MKDKPQIEQTVSAPSPPLTREHCYEKAMKKRILALLPWVLAALCIAYLAASALPHQKGSGFDLQSFGNLPVLTNGRVKPLDTVARTSRLFLQHRQKLPLEQGGNLEPIGWLCEVLLQQDMARQRPVFLIHDPDVLGVLGWKEEQGKRFSFRELEPHLEEINRQAQLANLVEAPLRSRFQRDILRLHQQISLYHQLRNSLQPQQTGNFQEELAVLARDFSQAMEASQKSEAGEAFDEALLTRFMEVAKLYLFQVEAAYFFPVPPIGIEGHGTEWQKVGASVLETAQAGIYHPAVKAFASLSTTYRSGDATGFNSALKEYTDWLKKHCPRDAKIARWECFFNHFSPFPKSMVLYVLAFVLACISWLVWPRELGHSALVVLAISLAIHSAGLICRMFLEGRPPVTNLYSSAIFIGWATVVLGLTLELLYRNGIGSATAAISGFLSLLIAHHLTMDGDTMEMMRAVLDSNFWLATHVVVITLGYAASFLAGFLAVVYIIRGTLTKSLEADTASALTRMVYGIICFATLFSFVGTVLGGIWADQSWGRFWGWDPKENGALLIVLWNAIILHARWGGMVRQQGMMVMAVFGNIVTSWSWFGTNMLGIGLHSYGFMDAAFRWLVLFVFSQWLCMLLGSLPKNYWRSNSNTRS